VGQRGDGGGSNAVDVAGDAGPITDDTACDCSGLAPPETDAEGEPLPRCDGGELLTGDGYECIGGACAPIVVATTCPMGCSVTTVFGGVPRCAN
jgi:hypothetical protein